MEYIPPQAVEIEQNILGGVLSTVVDVDDVIARFGKDYSVFYRPQHSAIYQAMVSLSEENLNVDLISVEHRLRRSDELDQMGGPGYLSDLTRHSTGANTEYYLEVLMEKHIARKALAEATQHQQALLQGEDPFDELGRHQQTMGEIMDGMVYKQARPISLGIDEFVEELAVAGARDGITGVACGLDLDSYTSGFQPGDLYILAARPSMGKTALALTIALNCAMPKKGEPAHPILFYSLEMSEDQLKQRLLSMLSKVDLQVIRKRQVTSEQANMLRNVIPKVMGSKLHIDDAATLSAVEMRAKSRVWARKNPSGMIVVDYLQLMSGEKGRGQSREQEVSSISRGLKHMAKELKMPVLALSQLSRKVEERGGEKRPQLSDLRESGAIEQDADMVMFIHREEYYGRKVNETGQNIEGTAELIIAKQRNGPVGTVNLKWTKENARFDNLSYYERQYGVPDLPQTPDGLYSVPTDESVF